MRTRRQLQVSKSKVPLPERSYWIHHSFIQQTCQPGTGLLAADTAAIHAKGPALWELAFIHDLNTGLGSKDTDSKRLKASALKELPTQQGRVGSSVRRDVSAQGSRVRTHNSIT